MKSWGVFRWSYGIVPWTVVRANILIVQIYNEAWLKQAYCDSDIRYERWHLEKTVNARARTEQVKFYEGGNLCFCESRNGHCRISVEMRRFSGWEWHPQPLTGKCTTVGKLWRWGCLPRLSAILVIPSGITSYRTKQAVTLPRGLPWQRQSPYALGFVLCNKATANLNIEEVELLKSQRREGNTWQDKNQSAIKWGKHWERWPLTAQVSTSSGSFPENKVWT